MQLKQWFRDHNRHVFPAVFAAIVGLLLIAFNFFSIEQSFVQQPFRTDGNRARSSGDPLHTPTTLRGREAALDDAPDDGPGHDSRQSFLRNRQDEVHRAWPITL